MIQRDVLLSDLRRLLPRLVADLRGRAASDTTVDMALRAEHEAARKANRTGEAFEVWREAWLTQVGVAWLLSLVFVRYLEDNNFIPPRFAGSGVRGQRADEHRQLYIRANPTHSDARYLHHVLFDEVGALPGARGLFAQHNLARALAPSGDLATELLTFFAQQRDAGVLRNDFADMRGDTRFLGDLYQDLSEDARERFALLQTPDFVEEFILDHTLEPALETFGLAPTGGFRLIDPTCGSGHFLLGAFGRLLERWRREAPAVAVEDLAQRALDAVWGVDINPFAVAIARFRLLLAALEACGVRALKDAHDFKLNVTAADSLLAAPMQTHLHAELGNPLYRAEDPAAIARTFGQQYHAVVGNPPYITVKDKVLNGEYRRLYPRSCYRQYSLGVPFTEQFFGLAVVAGFVGLITANSFMKREFGKSLIEQVLPGLDLTHVVDTSNVPLWGTPTVILFGRNRAQVAQTVRAIQGIRGEPTTLEVPANGLVWRSIAGHVGDVGFQNEFVSVVDAPVHAFRSHPWSLQGGGADMVKGVMDTARERTLDEVVTDIGAVSVIRSDDAFEAPLAPAFNNRLGNLVSIHIVGENVRDWQFSRTDAVLFPYDADARALSALPPAACHRMWPFRHILVDRVAFGKTQLERGLKWFEYSMLFRERYLGPFLIVFPNVATHNHFVLLRERAVVNSKAPVIKLPAGATEDDHIALLSLLNSSAACFWMKQVCQSKGAGGVGGGYHSEDWSVRREFDGTKLRQFPVVPTPPALLDLTRRLDAGAAALAQREALAGLERGHRSEVEREAELAALVSLQEELDWHVYRAYGFVRGDDLACVGTPPPILPGDRAFEIALARAVDAGEATTAWFERHGATPRLEASVEWPPEYQALVDRRLVAIAEDPTLRLLEQPEYKRRWSTEPYADLVKRNTRAWLLDRLETPNYRGDTDAPTLLNTAALADHAARDPAFLAVARVYAGRDDFDLTTLVAELVLSESVPALPALRFTESGLRLREVWEQVWDLQRREDAGETVTIPVPPKYGSGDFRDAVSWRMRGKLDVPKERFNVYPYAARPGDRGAWVTWAGLDHLQRARALAGTYLERKDHDGWSAVELTPFLAELDQLVPWLKQWHNEPDPDFGRTRMGDYYAEFVTGQIHAQGLRLDEVRAWAPSAKRGRGGKKGH